MPKAKGILTKEYKEKLKTKYEKFPKGSIEWNYEKKNIGEFLSLVEKDISPRYEIREPLGVGGVGIVMKVFDKNLKIPCALKFPRPKSGKEELFAEIFENEISQLLELRHPNIIEIHYQNKIKFADSELPFYIMEFIPDAKDALEYLSAQPRKLDDLISLIKQVVKGICHLKKLNIVHLDIKLENMLISSDGRAVLSDLGSARHLSRGPKKTLVIFTSPWAHPELQILRAQSTSSDSNRVRAPIDRSKLRSKFDLYALGKNLRRILELHEPEKWKDLDPYTRKYLDLMATRLLDGQNSPDECALGLPPAAYKEIRYEKIFEVASDIDKLTGEYPLTRVIPEMDEYGIQTIQTSSLCTTPFTKRFGELINHPAISRLGGITQLGLTALVYPTATHTRLEHVLGTYSNVVRYCNTLYHDHINPLFKQLINEDDLKAILLAALLHDVGQYPLAHDLEEAESNIFSHKIITEEFLDGKTDSLEYESLKKIIKQEWGISLNRIAAIIKADPTNLDHSIKDRMLNTLIDSSIDADKLDYLVRDSLNLSVPFGKAIDFNRLLQCLTIIFKKSGNRLYIALGIHEKGKIPAETIAFVRYTMFGAVYWHHTIRSIKAMLHRAVWDAMPPKNKRNELRAFVSNFHDFAKNLEETTEETGLLFSKAEPTISLLTQISPSDRKVLEWIAEHTSEECKCLIKMIIKRDLYKRIHVVSSRKNLSLWKALIKFQVKFGWESILELQKDFESKIVNFIRHIDPRMRTVTALEKEATDKVIKLSKEGSVIILVDVPTERKASKIPLEYLPESDRKEMLKEWKTPCDLEDSIIWTHLFDSFLEATGKIRIFCHPQVHDTIKAAIRKDQLDELLEESLKFISK